MAGKPRITIRTSRYFGSQQLIEASGLVPVGHTVGAPRFGAPQAGNVGMLAPHGLIGKELSDKQFRKLYRERLDQFGVEKIEAVLAAIARAYDKPGVVLLCFENVLIGESCHRRIFADWWEQQTGDPVPELASLTLEV
jgi:hypothetical protein